MLVNIDKIWRREETLSGGERTGTIIASGILTKWADPHTHSRGIKNNNKKAKTIYNIMVILFATLSHGNDMRLFFSCVLMEVLVNDQSYNIMPVVIVVFCL